MSELEPTRLGVRIAAPAKEVWHALTDPAEMRVWLAEHAEVSLPGTYTFWGRYTPEGDAPRQRVLHAGERELRFAWPLDGVETTVGITLEEDGDGTVVRLVQSDYDHEATLNDYRGSRSVLMTYWYLMLGNLADHCEGRPITALIDLTDPVLRTEVLIDAPRSRVFHSMIDSEEANAWFGYPIGIEPYVGGRFAMGGLDIPDNPAVARIIDLVPDERLAVDWGQDGVHTWEMADSDGATRLTFVHSGFGDGEPPYAMWLGSVSGLVELRRYHEIPDWKPRWVLA